MSPMLPAYNKFSATVPQNASQSGLMNIGDGMIIGISAPAALEATTTQLSFLVGTSAADASPKALYVDNAKLTMPITVSTDNHLSNTTAFMGEPFIAIVTENSSGSPVTQSTADRIFTITTLASMA